LIASTLALLAAPPGEGGPSFAPMIFMWGSIILIFYFLLIRPQRQAAKRHQAMLQALRKGDEVMTEGGILGEVVHLKEDRVTIRTGENTRIVVARPKIARVIQPPATE
jgi:preprotein translocase subunit YajC